MAADELPNCLPHCLPHCMQVRRYSIRGVLQASNNNSILNETLGFSDTIGIMSSVINTTVAYLPFDADGKGGVWLESLRAVPGIIEATTRSLSRYIF